MAKCVELTVLKRRNKYGIYEKCPPSLTIREMQIKIALRLNLTIQNGHHQKTNDNKCW